MKHTFGRLLCGLAAAFCLCGPAAAQWVFPPGSSLDVPAGGQTDLGCSALDMQGTLNLNGGTVTVDTDATFGSGAVVNGNNGVISVGGNLISTGGNVNTGASTVVLRDGCDPGNSSQISGNFVFQNLTISSTTGRTFVLPAGTNITVLGTLTVQGTQGQPVQLVSSSGATAVVNLGPNATVVRNFASVPGNVQIGAVTAVAAIPTLSEYGLMLLSLLIGLAMFWKRREFAAHARRLG
ncbi:IPTL-CTERM sorting domain-containing protein [Paracidovorax valerianellae]|uniref:IPTL-CTERM protein sorting domain-containing protein n=1 Tax=Paracidovorax valerianellae TaxID=187868 RepID=A0A1G6X088_9BURK|nr:IPTL-CTERM sorting domain-containing protein [Paracidovorax valerianellae]MDA8447697.1 IPTL-CTERM sorting domain-containing protein [Paracidovorax valerianellae]SDD71464.1 IPTL-CTERM protein sorting domain-containing protein [Paracidovorax valerianellae]